MGQRKITLEQVQELNHVDRHDSLVKAEEGEIIDGFRVTNVKDVECEHPDYRWKIEEQVSSEVPNITGVCRVCGDEKIVHASQFDVQD